MSLELAIQANTAAINNLIAVLAGGKFMSADALKDVMTVAHVSGEVGPDVHETFKPVVEKAVVPAPVIEQPEEVKAPAAVEPTGELIYETDVLPVLHKFLVAKGGRTGAEKLLKKYGVDKFSKVPAGDLCALLNDLQAEMGVA